MSVTEEDFEAAYDDSYYELGVKDKRIVVLMKIAGGMTMLSAMGVAMETAYDHFSGHGTVLSRTQFFFQIPIFMFALVHFMGSWVAPEGTPGWNTSGNIATCEALGYLKQFSLTLLPIDMWISTLHILMVRYNWKEARLRKYEKFVHLIVWPVGLVAATLPLVVSQTEVPVSVSVWIVTVHTQNQLFLLFQNDNLNVTYDLCGMMNSPYFCDEEEGCLRGDQSRVRKAHIAISSFNIVAVTYAMFAMANIYLYVRHLENQNARYSSSSLALGNSEITSAASRAHSRAVATQGILYATATTVAYLPSALEMILFFAANYEEYWIYTLHRFFAPMLGTFNMMVFFRNRSTMHTRYGTILQKATSCCCGGAGARSVNARQEQAAPRLSVRSLFKRTASATMDSRGSSGHMGEDVPPPDFTQDNTNTSGDP